MLLPYYEITPDLLSAADLVLAINPARPLDEIELYCDPAFAVGGKSILRAVRVVLALLDPDKVEQQIESLRQAVSQAKPASL